MKTAQEMENNYQKRISRIGNDLYQFLLYLEDHDKISGEDALLIMNTVGLRSDDVYLMCKLRGVDIHLDSFVKLINEQENRMKNIKQC